jgi:hypothetical protein
MSLKEKKKKKIITDTLFWNIDDWTQQIEKRVKYCENYDTIIFKGLWTTFLLVDQLGKGVRCRSRVAS